MYEIREIRELEPRVTAVGSRSIREAKVGEVPSVR